ncbi:hypothetical protein [Saccharophagus sp. K07]|mgnify:CR=1 FL=1|uniref:hypothetical protein n=1 Tax=Saccharophagus sp. K07 TaxID=2283636 RepID=UPI001CA3559B|nr:hypothetical protein [Saccharophagus sp. K07]
MTEQHNGQSLKEKLSARMSHIKGWGVDANPKNDPTYPMRKRFDGDHMTSWGRPAQQPGHEDILHSNERPDVTRVFGTSAPVSGLSGMIRRCAFKYSEGRFAHWLLLLAADRVNMVEGFAQDICHGRATNCITDKGLKAKWKYDRNTVVTQAAVGVAVVGVLALICLRRHRLPQRGFALVQHAFHQPSRLENFLLHSKNLMDLSRHFLRSKI